MHSALTVALRVAGQLFLLGVRRRRQCTGAALFVQRSARHIDGSRARQQDLEESGRSSSGKVEVVLLTRIETEDKYSVSTAKQSGISERVVSRITMV